MGRALWDTGITQWVEHCGIGEWSVGRALQDNRLVEHNEPLT